MLNTIDLDNAFKYGDFLNVHRSQETLNSKFLLPLTSSIDFIRPSLIGVTPYFDGIDDYIDFGDALPSISISSTYSIVIWFKTGCDVQTEQHLINNVVSASDRNIMGTITSGTLRFGHYDGSSYVRSVFGNIKPNTVYCVISTGNGSELTLHINNVSQTDIGTPTSTVSTGFVIGRRTGGTKFFNGEIYQVQFYNRLLSSTEKTHIYNAGKDTIYLQENLIASYDFQKTTNFGKSNIIDLSGNGIFGTFYNKFYFNRNTEGSCVNASGYVDIIDADFPRFSGVRKGKNFILFSETLSSSIWSKQSNVVVTNNAVIAPNGKLVADKYSLIAASNRALSQTISLEDKTYTLSFWIKAKVDTSILYAFNGSTTLDIYVSNGWTKVTRTTTFDLSGNKTFTLYDVSGNYGDMFYLWGFQIEEGSYASEYIPTGPVPRTMFYNTDVNNITIPSTDRNGLLMESQSTNHLIYSNDLLSRNVSTLMNLSYTANQATGPDGKMSMTLLYADADKSYTSTYSDTPRYYLAISLIEGNQYTYSFYVKYKDLQWIRARFDVSGNFGGVNFDILNGVIGSVSSGWAADIEYIGNDIYRCSVTTTSGSTAMYGAVQLIENDSASGTVYSGEGVYIYGEQIEESSFATSYIETEASTVTRTGDILIYDVERLLNQKENLLAYSENFGMWSASDGATVTDNQTEDPNGDTTADLLDVSSSGVSRIIRSYTANKTTNYTFSIYLKAVSEAGTFPIRLRESETGTNIDLLAEVSPSEWRRFEITGSFTSGNSVICYCANNQVSGNTLTSAYAWGAQLNEGKYAKEYLSTNTTTLTSGKGSFYFEFNCFGRNGTSNSRFFELNDGSVVNRILCFINSSADKLQFNINSSSVTSVSIIDSDTFSYKEQNKVCITYENDNVVFYLNGSVVDTDTSATIPANLTHLGIGCNQLGAPQIDGFIKDFKYFNFVLSEADALRITT